MANLEFPSFFLSIIALLVTLYVVGDTTKIRKSQEAQNKRMKLLALNSIYDNSFALINNLDLFSKLDPANHSTRLSVNQNIFFLYNRIKTDLALYINHFSDKQIEELKRILDIFAMSELGSTHTNAPRFLMKVTSDNIINLLKKFVEDHCTEKQYSHIIEFLNEINNDKNQSSSES